MTKLDNSATEAQILAQEMAKLQRGNIMMEEDIRDENEVYAALSADFPAEAMSVDKSRGFALTSVKAQFVTERLNEALGIMNWTFGGDFKETDKGVLYMGALVITVNGKQNRQFAPGYAEFGPKKLVGDIYKSAMTDSLSKAASKFGIANSVFKGEVDASSLGKTTARAAKKSGVKSDVGETDAGKPEGFETRRRSRASRSTATSNEI